MLLTEIRSTMRSQIVFHRTLTRLVIQLHHFIRNNKYNNDLPNIHLKKYYEIVICKWTQCAYFFTDNTDIFLFYNAAAVVNLLKITNITKTENYFFFHINSKYVFLLSYYFFILISYLIILIISQFILRLKWKNILF